MQITYECGPFGLFTVRPTNRSDTRTILIQSPDEYPGLALSFGAARNFGERGGDDPDDRESVVWDARDWLWDNEGATTEDPGYFK